MTDPHPAAPIANSFGEPDQRPDSAAVEEKIDPGRLTLRSAPIRAIRFRRGIVVGSSLSVLVVLLAAAWFALEPRQARTTVDDSQQAIVLTPPSDALAKAPASYSDVPKLGPPLPGDLGKPLLEHEQAQPVVTSDRSSLEDRQAQTQWAAEQKAAMQSGLLAQASNRSLAVDASSPSTSAPASANSVTQIPGQPRPLLDPGSDPNAQTHKAEFVASQDREPDENGHAVVRPAARTMLSAGSVISASLITGLRSDLPGFVTAQVTQNVYDSATGSTLLLPQGTRLIGSYDSVVAFGQRRALLVWQRILLPDGSSVRIDNVPATDASGYAGLADQVDFHSWMLLKAVALSTLLGVSSDLALSGQGDLVQALRLSTQDSLSRAGDQITQRSLQVQPTITIRPGAIVKLVVHRDLILAPWTESPLQ